MAWGNWGKESSGGFSFGDFLKAGLTTLGTVAGAVYGGPGGAAAGGALGGLAGQAADSAMDSTGGKEDKVLPKPGPVDLSPAPSADIGAKLSPTQVGVGTGIQSPASRSLFDRIAKNWALKNTGGY